MMTRLARGGALFGFLAFGALGFAAGATTADLLGIAGDAAGAVAVGTSGRVLASGALHTIFLTAQTPDSDVDLHACAGNGSGTYFIVGAGGTIWKSSAPSGAAFVAETSPTGSDLLAVSPFLLRMVAAGEGGAIVRSAQLLGGGWTVVASPVAAALRALARNTTTGVAVGDDGTILRGDAYGSIWSVVEDVPAEGADLLGVAVLTDQRFLVVGAGGMVLRGLADGLTWTRLAPPDAVTLHGVAVEPGGAQTVVAVGEGGAVFVSTDAGDTWSAVAAGAGRTLHAIAWTGSDFLAAGDHGTLLRSTDGWSWFDQTPVRRASWGAIKQLVR